MYKAAIVSVFAITAPLGASAATEVFNDGVINDITSDTLFTGIVESFSDGPGSYVVRFETPGATVFAIADAAVTDATVATSFTNLTMSWIDGLNENTLVSATGVDTLSTTFNTAFPRQRLVFDWSDSDVGAGFRLDVQAPVSAIPLPASILLMGSALAGLGLFGRRRKQMGGATA